MKRLVTASIVLAAVAGLAGLGSALASKGGSGSTTGPSCPKSLRAGWQHVADVIRAPVYCPSWLPGGLTGEIKGQWNTVNSVNRRDRSYLIGFAWQENGQEVHLNLRGYPGRTAIPTCRETELTGGKVHASNLPCFSDPSGTKRFGSLVVTVFTVNQDADQWHILYAWRYRGSLYTVSMHVAPPFASARSVMQNLDKTMRALVRLEPRASAS